MNSCIKTGADVWDTNEAAMRHGDLYRIDGYYVLRYVGEPQYERGSCENECYATFDTRRAYLDRQKMYWPANAIQTAFAPFLDLPTGAQYGYAILILSDEYVSENPHHENA